MDPNFVEVQTKFSADLHPSTLRNVTGSFQSILDDLLLTYRERLGGIVLGYHDERIVNKTASVHAFFPYFHVDAEATLSVLRLEKHKHLVGRINKLAPDYIGMLVLGAFNAVVHKDQLRGKFKFDKQGGVWVQCSDQTCRLKAGSMVKFAINRVDASSSRFLIIGTMLPDSCTAFEPGPGAPAAPPGLGLALAAAAGGNNGSPATALGVRLHAATVSPPALGPPSPAAGPPAQAEEAPRSDGTPARKKKKSKRKARDTSCVDAAPVGDALASDTPAGDPPSGGGPAQEDQAAGSGGDGADDAVAAPVTDADAAVDDGVEDAVDAGDAAADAGEDAEEVPEKPKKKKKKKKKRNKEASEEAAAAADEVGANLNGATAAVAVDADAVDEEAAAAAPRKRKSKAALDGVGDDADGDAERRAAKKEKKRRKAEAARAREEAGAVLDGADGALGQEDDAAEAPAADGGNEELEADQPVGGGHVGKKRKSKGKGVPDDSGADAAAVAENGAKGRKKHRKSRKADGGGP